MGAQPARPDRRGDRGEPTPTTAATRTPATIDGSASGSSTCRSSCRGVIPIASPASTNRRIEPCGPATSSGDRQERVEDQHDERGARADAADERQRQQEAEQREARDGLRRRSRRPTSGAASRGRRAAKMPGGHADRDRDERRDSDEQHVLRSSPPARRDARSQKASSALMARPSLRHPRISGSSSGRTRGSWTPRRVRRDRTRPGGQLSTPTRSAERERFAHVVGDDDDGLAHLRLDAAELAMQFGARDADRARRTARPSAETADRRRARGRRRRAAAVRPRARRASAPRIVRRSPTSSSSSPTRALRPRRPPNPAAAGRPRRCPPPACAGKADILKDVADAPSQLSRVPLARVPSVDEHRCRAPASSSRLMSLRSVLFPAPLRPTSATISPAPTTRLNQSSTFASADRLNDTSRNSIAAAGIPFATCTGHERYAKKANQQSEPLSVH